MKSGVTFLKSILPLRNYGMTSGILEITETSWAVTPDMRYSYGLDMKFYKDDKIKKTIDMAKMAAVSMYMYCRTHNSSDSKSRCICY